MLHYHPQSTSTRNKLAVLRAPWDLRPHLQHTDSSSTCGGLARVTKTSSCAPRRLCRRWNSGFFFPIFFPINRLKGKINPTAGRHQKDTEALNFYGRPCRSFCLLAVFSFLNIRQLWITLLEDPTAQILPQSADWREHRSNAGCCGHAGGESDSREWQTEEWVKPVTWPGTVTNTSSDIHLGNSTPSSVCC